MAPVICQCRLPLDLVYDILLRLPVKSLLRFLLVCKQWRVLITSVSFMLDHFNHESNQVLLLVRWDGPYNIQGLSFFMDETLERYEDPGDREIPRLIDSIVGPCNGVFCVTNLRNKLAMWNPSTGKMRSLLTPQCLDTIGEIGFGVDPFMDEFKIVLIRHTSYVSIYTSSNDSWRYFENKDLLRDSFLLRTICGTTFSKGFFYWRKYNTMASTSVLLAFDMRNEVFKEIELPNDIRNEPCLAGMHNEYNWIGHRVVFDTFDDSLVMFCYPRSITSEEENRDVNESERNCIDIWVMKEQGCWIRTFTLRLPFSFYHPLGFWMGKHILFSRWDGKAGQKAQLVMYDPDSGNKRILRLPSRDYVWNEELWAFRYKESLFPVKGRNEIQDYGTQSVVSRKFFSRRCIRDFSW